MTGGGNKKKRGGKIFRFSFTKLKRKHLNFYTYTNLRFSTWGDKPGQEICKKKK